MDFVIYVYDDDALVGEQFWVGAAVEIGTDQIWAGNILTEVVAKTAIDTLVMPAGEPRPNVVVEMEQNGVNGGVGRVENGVDGSNGGDGVGRVSESSEAGGSGSVGESLGGGDVGKGRRIGSLEGIQGAVAHVADESLDFAGVLPKDAKLSPNDLKRVVKLEQAVEGAIHQKLGNLGSDWERDVVSMNQGPGGMPEKVEGVWKRKVVSAQKEGWLENLAWLIDDGWFGEEKVEKVGQGNAKKVGKPQYLMSGSGGLVANLVICLVNLTMLFVM